MHVADFIMPHNLAQEILLKVQDYNMSLSLQNNFLIQQRIVNKIKWIPRKDL